MTQPAPAARRLVVVRHAKAEPYAATDHDRELTDSGRLAAREAGVWLRGRGIEPDTALVSSAARTRQTWTELAAGLGVAGCEVSITDELFAAGVDVVVDALRAVPAERRTVLFVGHNPTAAYLCHHLDDGDGDQAAISGLVTGFPPAALTVFDVEGEWSDLGVESGRVLGYHVGVAR